MNGVKIAGCRLSEELYNGSRTLVYRACRETDSLPVVIKLLKNPYPSFSELVQFRNQYTIAKNIHSPNIIETYSLEPYQNGYALVMEDFEGISLKQLTILETLYQESLEEFLYLAIALCDTLETLIRHRIIHKDIKPGNILINRKTKQVKLIDFSIASLLAHETQTLVNPNVLEGTLNYISPEQTGRMNRGIDYRTDFYSLGVTFYELLTGELPFQSKDAMELVHCHIAKAAPLVHEINSVIPPMLSEIVNKLMAKNAEDRYQSPLGLKYDLEKCLVQLKETGKIRDFPIAQRDVCDRFIIPDKLYGRETEVETLLQAFERVSRGATEMILISGFSGIGKTAVVNEVHKPIIRQRSYFIKGKFDQFNRNIPLSAFVQMFQDLIHQFLTESDAEIQEWKRKILAAVGETGQIITEVIPELERIIGKQPPAPELSGNAAQNRFNLLLQKFTKAFASLEHPLVMFLDDLQWADSASLKLMELLITDTQNLLLIGAYRDNEVNLVHPLMLTLSEIAKTEATINTITLAPLSQTKINTLVADTLKCSEDLAWNLSQLVSQKTQGNPFFATQFLKSLHQDNLIQFNFESGCWACDITQVMQQVVTDDVVAFMAFQLRRLPRSTQQVLQLAACIGNQFDLATLAIVSEQLQIETASSLWKALQEGLILPTSEIYKFYIGDSTQEIAQDSQSVNYKFLHDRVQQAAYALIAEDRKQATHLQIGQLLLRDSSSSEREERLFQIVNHLNVGIPLIKQPQERENLAELNLAAGRKAKTATAYGAAINYLATGIKLLPTNAWESHYPLMLALHEEIAEASCVNTDFEEMEKWARVVQQQAKTLLDKIKVQQTRIMGAKSQGRFLDAIQIGLQVLHSLGIEFPEQPTQADIGQAFGVTRSLWVDKPPLSLLNLPTMHDQELLAAMEILTVLVAPAYMAAPNLMPLLIFKQVELSLQFGNCPISVFAYGDYGAILCGIIGDMENGYEFGELALSFLDRLQLTSFKCRNWYVVHTYIKHWKITLSKILPSLQEAYRSGLETGDMESACLNAASYSSYSYHAGQELTELVRTMDAYRQTIHQYKQTAALYYQEIYQQTVLNLLAQTEVPYVLTGTIFNQKQALSELQAANQRTALFYWHLNQSILYYLFGQEQKAAQISAQTAQYLDGGVATFMVPLYSFFDALIQLTQYAAASIQERQAILLKVQQHQDKLYHWAALAPTNHQHRWELVRAEQYRLLGNKTDAVEAYDRAIQLAHENGFIQDEALANELIAKFYLDWGKEKVARTYMQEAYYCYAKWGALAKVTDLEKRYPQLLQPILQQQRISLKNDETIAFHETFSSTQTSASCSGNISTILDFTSVLKAAQAISSCLELDVLIANLTQIILENSGAKKSVLLLPEEETWQVRAMTLSNHGSNSQTDVKTILTPQLLNACPDIPKKLINYVKNTQETVIIENYQTNILGVMGEYMELHRPQSVLCTPIIKQGHLVGILYLENKLTSGVFTNERLQVIKLLSSQAAISLENARLYQRAQQALQDLQQAQLQIVQSEKMSALGNLVAGVAHEMNNPLGFISASLKQAKPSMTDIFEHLKLYQEKFPNPGDEILAHAEESDLDYSLQDLPRMIESMVIACDRLKNISTSLRTFSRADQHYKVRFNIHEGIDSTILILKHRLKQNEQRPAIEVITEYGDLPQIECFPGQLNQVFMNLLANAIDALEESNNGRYFADIKIHPNRITIKTSILEHLVKIAIVDNGIGMSEGVKQKIFDHSFTTKGVGRGTGLGLAIAQQIIVEKHNGSVSVNSTLGVGTEFIITLPILGGTLA